MDSYIYCHRPLQANIFLGLVIFDCMCACPALLYELKVPRWDFQTGRQLRTSPLYDRLDTQGARWMEKHGFERPKYFVPPGKGAKFSLTRLFFFSVFFSKSIYSKVKK